MGKNTLFILAAIASMLLAVTPASAGGEDSILHAEPSTTLTLLSKAGDCTVYEFYYPSVNAAGESAVLSSALFAWTPASRQTGDSIESLHIYSHVTIGSNDERPTAPSFSSETTMLKLLPGRHYKPLLGSVAADFVGRCIIIAPDYEGYGLTSEAVHPYLSQRLTAQQVADAAVYGLELYKKASSDDDSLLPLKSDWRSFAFGFSQGGAVTLATHRHIEEQQLDRQLHFTGSICGDGPYDLLETIRYYIEDDGESYDAQTSHRRNMATMPVVIPLILKGMVSTRQELTSYGIGSYLSQQLIDTGVLEWIDSKDYSCNDMSRKWYLQLRNGLRTAEREYTPEQMGELFYSPKANTVWGHLDKMLTPDAYAFFAHPDSTPANSSMTAMRQAMADNSLAEGWEPRHPIQFFHSRADMVVPFGNYLSFRNAHPDGEDVVYRIDDTFSTSDHVGAGTTFFSSLSLLRSFAPQFLWLCSASRSDGISDVVMQAKTTGWYTIDGRCLQVKPTTRGLYIHDGKKTVVH